MELGLTGRVALVSGASRGIGAAIASRLAAEGAYVAVGYHQGADAAAQVVAAIEADGGIACAVPFDLLDTATIATAVGTVADRWGPIQVLVNNAGAFPSPGPFRAIPGDTWQQALRDQLEGPGNLIRAVLPDMCDSGWGRIVSISTVHALVGNPGVVAHTAAKSGLHGLTRSLAREVGRDGVLVNAVLPGLTITPETSARFPAERVAAAAESIPTRHPSTGEDIAALVAFLASAANGNVTGELIRSAGGL
jgi:NAD(P)-dependent dehydrogenase (short-subunit alcohol dehydrogenase family)